jgi:hypothetical protein
MIALQSENISLALPRADLSAKQRNEMFELLAQHFDGVTRAQFERDLAEKNWVILLMRDERLVGFSTLLAYESVFDGQTVSVVYSGDTIVAPEAWGTTALSRAWIACVRQLRGHYPRGKYYWLLLTSGFRTYRFLPVFWREFHPRFDVATPINQKRLLDQLADGRFGEQYNSEKGIVRFKQPQKLRSGLDAVPTGRSADPHVAFFLNRNPSHVLGDELVCLTELADENLTPAGRRMIQTRTNEFQSRHC